MSGFQSVVNNQPAPAVGGDFLSANPRVSEVGGPGAWVAPASGIVVNAFAWIANSGSADVLGSISQPSVGTPATTAPQAFVGRQGQPAIWYALLQQFGITIPQGYPVTLYNQGEFWMGGGSLTTTTAAGGQKVFASTTVPGQIAMGAAGATITGYIETKWYVQSGFQCAAGELVAATSWGP